MYFGSDPTQTASPKNHKKHTKPLIYKDIQTKQSRGTLFA